MPIFLCATCNIKYLFKDNDGKEIKLPNYSLFKGSSIKTRLKAQNAKDKCYLCGLVRIRVVVTTKKTL